jgi:hypothetical protein
LELYECFLFGYHNRLQVIDNSDGQQTAATSTPSLSSKYHLAPRVKGYLLKEDKPDAQLPSLEDDIPSLDTFESTNGIAPDQLPKHHILSKRQVRNDYERFYLCVFTLFTNPNCNNNNVNSVNRQSDYASNNNYNSYDSYGGNSNGGYVPLFPRPPGTGLFGLGQGFGLFGNRLQNPNYNNNGLNSNNNFNQFVSQPTSSPFLIITPSPTTASTAVPFSNPYYPGFNQNPYPDPQVNRRPGPESLREKSSPVSSTTKDTTTFKTTPIPTTESNVPTSTRVSFVPPSNEQVKKVEEGSYTQQDEEGFGSNLDTQIVFSDRTEATPTVQKKNKTTTECPPENDLSSSTTTEEPKVPATFPILQFGDILAQATTPTSNPSEISIESDSDISSKDPNKDPEYFKLKLKIQELEQSRNTLRDSNLALTKQKFQLQQKYDEANNETESLRKENAALKAYEGANQEQVLSFQVQTKYLQEALATIKEEGSNLKQRIGQLERTNNHLQQTNGQLQHGNADQKTQLNELKAKVKYLEDKVVRMSAEHYAKFLEEARELKDKIRKLQADNTQCRNQVYEMQRKLQSMGSKYDIPDSGNGNTFGFDKRVGLLSSASENNATKEEIIVEAEAETDNPLMDTVVFQDEEIQTVSPVSGENSTEVSSSEIVDNIPSLVNNTTVTVASTPDFVLSLTSNTTNNITSEQPSSNVTQEPSLSPENLPFGIPFGLEFSSGSEVPGNDPNNLEVRLDPDFDVRIGNIGITGNGAITFGDDPINQGEAANFGSGVEGQSIYGQFPLFNLGQGYNDATGAHDNPWRTPFYPGAFNRLREDLGYAQNTDF